VLVLSQSFRRLLSLLLLCLLAGCQPAAPGGGAPGSDPSPSQTGVDRPGNPADTTPGPNRTPEGSNTASAPTDPVDVVIVGGGLSGLCTAYHLKKDGISYRILEATPRVGGRCRTGTYPDGSEAEVGLAEFWTGNPALDVIKELNIETELTEPGLSSFVVDGKLYPFLTENNNQEFIQHSLGTDYPQYQEWDKRMAGLIEQIESGNISPEMMKLKDISFAKWLRGEKLSPLAKAMVQAVLEPEIGTDIEKIGALDGIAEWHIFVGKGADPNHVKGGNEKLPMAIAKAIGEENISLNMQVTNVTDGKDGVEVRAVDNTNFDNRTYRAKYVVLTVPLYRLFEIQFQPRLSDKIYQAINTQSWGAYFTAHCLLDKQAEKFWTSKGETALPILSGGRLGCIYPGHEGGPDDAVMINCLVTGNAAEMYNQRTMSFDDVQKSMESAMEEMWPGSKKMIRRWTFYRYHPRAIASWPVGRSRFDDLSNEIRKPYGHMYFAGDFTESSHSDGATISALRVKSAIAKAMGKE
jgi:monoamine oxidase